MQRAERIYWGIVGGLGLIGLWGMAQEIKQARWHLYDIRNSQKEIAVRMEKADAFARKFVDDYATQLIRTTTKRTEQIDQLLAHQKRMSERR